MSNKRYPRAKWVLPSVVDPPERLCFQIEVPNERQHIAAFMGALYTLTSAIFWQDNAAHTAKQVALVWRDIFDNLRRGCDCPIPLITIAELEYEMSICEQLRFNDQGVLQGFCCGEWVDIAGGEKFELAHPGQQGGNAPQPSPGGGQVCYHVAQQASYQYLLPTVVNAGDVLTFSNLGGSATDGVCLGPLCRWDCPDGRYYFGGECQDATQSTQLLDPLNTAPHMSLVVQIAGTWYSALTPITVPGGVSNAQVIIQLNDDNIGDNQGSYSADVCVQNNALAEWCHYFDFRLSTNGFTARIPPLLDSGNVGHWVAGTGIVYDDWHQTSGMGEWFRGILFELDGIAPFNIVSAELLGDLTKGVYSSPSEFGAGVLAGVAGAFTNVVYVPNSGTVNGNGQAWSGSADVPNTDQLVIINISATSNPGNTLSGNAVVAGLKVRGKGPNPFGTSDCP